MPDGLKTMKYVTNQQPLRSYHSLRTYGPGSQNTCIGKVHAAFATYFRVQMLEYARIEAR